jgi:hypothetical protein
MEALEATFAARATAWKSWGTLEDDVITHLLNPSLTGGPRWPALRQAFRVARRWGRVLVASDGLSDPFDDGPTDVSGFGLEVFAVTSDEIEKVAGSWLFDAVWQMSQFAAQHGGLGPLIDELRYVTTELYDVKIPEEHQARFVNEAGRVAVLLGLNQPPLPARIEGPLGPIRLVHLKLLTLDELKFVLDGGDEARARLAEKFAAQPDALSSSLTRASVV